MKIPCPTCGERDVREFSYLGHASLLDRPDPDAGSVIWDDYLHNRENAAGDVEDLWYHEAGCAAYLVVSRNTVTHAVHGAKLAREVKNAG